MSGSCSGPEIIVRRMATDEFPAMRAVVVDAFGEDEDIGGLLDALRASWCWIDELAFVAVIGDAVVGQALYTHSIVDTPASLVDVLLLSPLAVRPDAQHLGIGSLLITTSLEIVRNRDEPVVFLEGDPGYYSQFGFRPAAPLGFTKPSVRIPDVAFQAILLPSWDPSITGALVYPDAFWRTDTVGLREPLRQPVAAEIASPSRVMRCMSRRSPW